MQPTCIVAIELQVSHIRDNMHTDNIVNNGTVHTWWRDEQGPTEQTPFDELLQMFDRASIIIGYNCQSFDFPLIKRFYRDIVNDCGERVSAKKRYFMHKGKVLDPFGQMASMLEFMPSLQQMLTENGLPSKISNGVEAINMWQSGKRKELAEYCTSDVLLTAKLVLKESITCDGIPIPHNIYSLRDRVEKQVKTQPKIINQRRKKSKQLSDETSDEENLTGMGYPPGGDARICSTCGDYEDYISEGMYMCYACG